MKVLITGGKGLLAHWLRQLAPPHLQLVLWDIEELDLTQPETVQRLVTELRPALVINTAAYNLVDRCEIERDLSWAVNARCPEDLARVCADIHAPLVHFSSDYVFDGQKPTPYEETDAPHPLNHYGAGKLYGEQAVLAASKNNLVLRTSWLFGPHPTQTKSYVHSVLRQAQSGAAIKATTDQVAAPTYAPDLADWTLALLEGGASGLFHAVNDEGLSRYDWTLAILASARGAGLLCTESRVEPVLTSSFGSTMKRPVYSVLSNRKAAARLGHPLGSWRGGLEEMLKKWGA
jgi:dTDP-4-dehydrorhamnose reductase